jgi:hypothetical protein
VVEQSRDPLVAWALGVGIFALLLAAGALAQQLL